ncbi:MAG: hypothetical protein ACJA09_001914 [Alcanivorax sp.]
MNKLLHPLFGYPVAGLQFLRSLTEIGSWLRQSPLPEPHTIPIDFFGVNVAPAEDPAIDDYIIARLQELGVDHVRMDFCYDSPGAPAERLLERLLDENFHVLLDIFPPLSEAEALTTEPEAQQRWRQFLDHVFKRYSNRIELFEIGNTPNRGRWSGFSSRTFLVAWDIALERAAAAGVRLAGANVSDFEPLYNAAYLSFIQTLGRSPEVHTDNLFVERVVEPEAFDHRVFGRAATRLLKLNLIKKARVLDVIGKQRGAMELICTYTCWTSKRLSRRSPWPGQKQADYMLRYLLLAASSGVLRQVYWGPLICNRDGLIDDSCPDYPVIDQVSYYYRVRGQREDFTLTPGFRTLAYCRSLLAGARIVSTHHQVDGLSVYKLQQTDLKTIHIAWCRDGQSYPIAKIFPPAALADATFHNSAGVQLSPPAVVCEQPLLIAFTDQLSADIKALSPDGKIQLCSEHHRSISHTTSSWTSAHMLRRDHQIDDLAAISALDGDKISAMPELRVLRDARNRLWNIADPRASGKEITVKQNRVKGIKRLTYRFLPSKGRRHWNNACAMLSRGVSTPLPVAFHERHTKPGIQDSWYLCEFVPDAFSCRDVYVALNRGDSNYRGLTKAQWFELLSQFVCNMHNKQIIHRDLSSGNLMLAVNELGEVTPTAIDIGRAWIWHGPGSRIRPRHRLLDLIRIAYKLNWPDRQHFIECYEAHFGRSLGPLWKVPFHYYDYKQRFKKKLKSVRKKRSA